MKKYDYDKLIANFGNMTDFTVRIEYADILNQLDALEKMLYGRRITESTYFSFCEPLLDAQRFIEGYLARCEIFRKGFTMDASGRIEFIRHGKDILSR